MPPPPTCGHLDYAAMSELAGEKAASGHEEETRRRLPAACHDLDAHTNSTQITLRRWICHWRPIEGTGSQYSGQPRSVIEGPVDASAEMELRPRNSDEVDWSVAAVPSWGESASEALCNGRSGADGNGEEKLPPPCCSVKV